MKTIEIKRYAGAAFGDSRLPLRFWAKVAATNDGCWLWTGAKSGRGYGQLKIARRLRQAHRFAFEILHGSIPTGVVLDHLCRVRNCVNPQHLECVSPTENKRRGESPSGVNAQKTHCPAGHPLSGENLYRCSARKGGRQCRACNRDKQRKRRALEDIRQCAAEQASADNQ